jgi:DNA-binding MarR family transcriptional regulator
MRSRPPHSQEDPVQAIGRECLGLSVRKTARVLARAYDEAFASLGLKSTQFPILAALHTMGPTGIGALAEALALDRTTMPRNLGPLERRGLIRSETGADRRIRTVMLTDAGEALLQEALPHWRNLQERLVTGMGGDRAEQLRAGLRDLARTADS